MSHTQWAHVSSNLVVNISVGTDPVDPLWLAAVQGEYTAVVDVTGMDPRPGIGWTYENGTFTPPPAPPDPDPPTPEP